MAEAEHAVMGERASCPVCGAEVLQKQMIPVLAEAGPPGHAYICLTCARARIDRSQTGEAEDALAPGSAQAEDAQAED